MKNIIIDSDQLEEIIRQSYSIGASECMVFGVNMNCGIKKFRVERISSDIQRQIFDDQLKPFDYEISASVIVNKDRSVGLSEMFGFKTELERDQFVKDHIEPKLDVTNELKVEQRIIGIEMLVEEFGGNGRSEISLHDYFEMTPNDAYDYCDEIFGGDSQHVRAKAKPIKLSPKIQNT